MDRVYFEVRVYVYVRFMILWMLPENSALQFPGALSKYSTRWHNNGPPNPFSVKPHLGERCGDYWYLCSVSG